MQKWAIKSFALESHNQIYSAIAHKFWMLNFEVYVLKMDEVMD